MKLFQNQKFLVFLNLLLTAALVMTLVMPAATEVGAQPVNPVSEEDILPIDTVDLGVVADGSLGRSIQATGSGQESGQSGEGGGESGQEPDPEQPEQQEATPEEDETAEQLQSAPKPVPQPTPDDPQDNGEGETEEAQEGEEGGEELEADLALVLTWYKYGREAKTVVCAPNSAVGRTIQDTQLEENRLRYKLAFSGIDADNAEITGIRFGLLNTRGQTVDDSGTLELELPEGQSENAYGFHVEAVWHTGSGEEQPLEFDIAIYYESGLDLEMELTWTDKTGSVSTIRCAADKTASDTIKSSRLQLGSLPYTLTMTGNSAEEAKLQSLIWRNESGESGDLGLSGNLNMTASDGEQDYTITAMVLVEEIPVTFTWVIHFESTLDLELAFTWYENGSIARTLTVEANESTSLAIKRNQLSGDQLQYAMELTGESAADASILSATLEGTGGGSLSVPSGSTFLTAPESGNARYTIRVTARVGGDDAETTQFTIPVRCASDVSLQMSYATMEETFTISCENKKEKQAPTLYDSQLTDGLLHYSLQLVGADAEQMDITSVSCYQSGSGRTIGLSAPNGSVTMLQAQDGREGENAFTITAQDPSGNEYVFKINIPYKHTGEDIVKISVNLSEGQVVANESEVIIAVAAWTEDENGQVLEYVTEDGLTVQLDGKSHSYTGQSGEAWQYTLIPENPEEGDVNDHVLHIYAEDSQGNYGELTVNFKGERSMEGQVIGEAKIYVDMSVLGLGTRGPISYDILKDEPVSYVIAKALWDYEDETFGAAKESYGWPEGSYSGRLEQGFYLRRLGDGSNLGGSANALSGNSWNDLGSTREEVWAAIDARFGAGSNLATLWRCIYNNGITLSNVEDSYSIGEFDFTGGSGWMYSIGGATFYPGTSMSGYELRDGDSLTLRFTLAYGWDVGSGQSGYGNSGVGYCVSCVNGSFSIHHNMETVTNEDGTTERRCRSCGIVEGCEHANVQWRENEAGLCGQFCADCRKYIQEPADHDWETQYREEDPENHDLVCKSCGKEDLEPHDWNEESNTADCLNPGEITWRCGVCEGVRTEQVEAAGHQADAGVWYVSAEQPEYHVQHCADCGEEIEGTYSRHEYDANWQCTVCGCWHDWECMGTVSVVSSTCQTQTLQCDLCGSSMEQSGTFEEHHHYSDGFCAYCGTPDPNDTEPEIPEEPEVPEEPETPEEPEVPEEDISTEYHLPSRGDLGNHQQTHPT